MHALACVRTHACVHTDWSVTTPGVENKDPVLDLVEID